MRQPRRRTVVAVALVAAAIVATVSIGFGRRRSATVLRDELPAFIPPPPGPRAPATAVFGFTVGVTSLREAQSWLTRRGMACADTSVRALMRRAREERRNEDEQRRARGESADAVTGASALNRPSPRESNPQVRLSCEDVPGAAVGAKDAPSGRLLLVFDSPSHPVRHVSFERTHPSSAGTEALADLGTTVQSFRDTFGPAHEDGTDVDALPWLVPVAARWQWSDLEVKVSALSFGARGTVVSQAVEVPWPVRADAPARPLAGRR